MFYVWDMNKWETLEQLCAKHDWSYEMSDDFRVWATGKAEFLDMTGLAKELAHEDDKRACSIWNRFAPACGRVGTFLTLQANVKELRAWLDEIDEEIETENARPNSKPMRHKYILQALNRERRFVLQKIEKIEGKIS